MALTNTHQYIGAPDRRALAPTAAIAYAQTAAPSDDAAFASELAVDVTSTEIWPITIMQGESSRAAMPPQSR